jgi:hypothetical protein
MGGEVERLALGHKPICSISGIAMANPCATKAHKHISIDETMEEK